VDQRAAGIPDPRAFILHLGLTSVNTITMAFAGEGAGPPTWAVTDRGPSAARLAPDRDTDTGESGSFPERAFARGLSPSPRAMAAEACCLPASRGTHCGRSATLLLRFSDNGGCECRALVCGGHGCCPWASGPIILPGGPCRVPVFVTIGGAGNYRSSQSLKPSGGNRRVKNVRLARRLPLLTGGEV